MSRVASPPPSPVGTETTGTAPAVRSLRPPLALHLMLGLAALAVTMLVATARGSVAIPLSTEVRILLDALPGVNMPWDGPESWRTILWQLRVPRVLLAAVVGAALALAGATYQGLFRNPLADPYLIGVAAGAGLGATIALATSLPQALFGVSLVTLLAFFGALGATTLAYALARVGKTVPTTTLVLAGVAIASVASALTSFLMLTRSPDVRPVLSWLLGGFASANWPKLPLVLPYVTVGALLVLLHARILNVLQLDEEEAAQLGVPVERVKLVLIIAASLATAAAVSVSGLIGFVGLIVPHTARLLWGPDHRMLLPMSMVLGAGFLVLADLLARTVIAPAEMPVGIITALCGGPFFLYLVRRRQRAVL
jgi:iron complex transport system permease protein